MVTSSLSSSIAAVFANVVCAMFATSAAIATAAAAAVTASAAVTTAAAMTASATVTASAAGALSTTAATVTDVLFDLISSDTAVVAAAARVGVVQLL